MIGDFGGGGMFLAFGVVAALLEAAKSGQGQVVDTAMVDGTAILMAAFWGYKTIGFFDENHRGTNLLDTGSHFYDVYETKDGKYVSIGSIEPQFYAELLRLSGLADDPAFATKQNDKTAWPDLKKRIAELFKSKTRAEWNEIMEMTDVCYAPVLTMSEAAQHPHNIARNTFVDIGGVTQPAPAPRFSRSVPDTPTPPAHPGQHSREILADWGFSAGDIDHLCESGAVKSA
jgi:alpha-methylacyl-CoA racemase